MLALFLESKDEKLPNESSACPFRKPKPELGFYFLSSDFYSMCLEEYQILFCRSPPSDELCVPEFPLPPVLPCFFRGAPFYRNTVVLECLLFPGHHKMLQNKFISMPRNAFYLRIGNSLIVIRNICAQPLLGPCKSLF